MVVRNCAICGLFPGGRSIGFFVVAQLRGGEERGGRAERRRAEHAVALVVRTRAGGRQRGHVAASGSRLGWLGRLRRTRLVTALAGALAVLTAAGPLRALLVVLADVRVFAFPFIAPTVLGAVAIDAAFGANAGAVVEVFAAEEAVAAVELFAAIV